MKIYGVVDAYNAEYGEVLEIDRYFVSKEKALEYILAACQSYEYIPEYTVVDIEVEE